MACRAGSEGCSTRTIGTHARNPISGSAVISALWLPRRPERSTYIRPSAPSRAHHPASSQRSSRSRTVPGGAPHKAGVAGPAVRRPGFLPSSSARANPRPAPASRTRAASPRISPSTGTSAWNERDAAPASAASFARPGSLAFRHARDHGASSAPRSPAACRSASQRPPSIRALSSIGKARAAGMRQRWEPCAWTAGLTLASSRVMSASRAQVTGSPWAGPSRARARGAVSSGVEADGDRPGASRRSLAPTHKPLDSARHIPGVLPSST